MAFDDIKFTTSKGTPELGKMRRIRLDKSQTCPFHTSISSSWLMPSEVFHIELLAFFLELGFPY